MNLKKHIATHIREIPKSGIREFFDIVAQQKEVISLGVGEPDFDTPWHIREAAIYSLEKGRTHYTSNLGLPELRAQGIDVRKSGIREFFDIVAQQKEVISKNSR